MTVVEGFHHNDNHPSCNDDDLGLERTIEVMSESQACFHPIHFHSFQSVSFLIRFRDCSGCGKHLQSGVFRSGFFNSVSEIVQCVACGQYAHRSCAFSQDTTWKEICPVNSKIAKGNDNEETQQIIADADNDVDHMIQSDTKDHGISEQNDVVQNDSESTNETHTSFSILSMMGLAASKSSDTYIATESSPAKAQSDNCIPSDVSKEQLSQQENAESSSAKRSNDTTENKSTTGPSKANFPFLSSSKLLEPKRSVQQTEEVGKIQSRTDLTEKIEDSIVAGNTPVKQPSKASFPFLSAARLLPSYSEDSASDVDTHTIEFFSNNVKITGLSNGPSPNTAFQKSPFVGDELHDPNLRDYDSKPTDIKFSKTNQTEIVTQNKSLDAENEKSTTCMMTWTADGPPPHWTTGKSVEDVIPKANPTQQIDDESLNENEPLHFSNHPFTSISRALQENLVVHFRPVVNKILPKNDSNEGFSDLANVDPEQVSSILRKTEAPITEDPRIQSENVHLSRSHSIDSETPSEAEVEGLLNEAKPGKSKETKNAHKRLGLATVAGGIAGGVAGLVFAGPVGGVIGAKCGQTAGILGVILEGSVSIGVLASGIAAGQHTGRLLHDKIEEKRVLALGEDGCQRRVLLVRPNVKTDPEWSDIYSRARQDHRDSNSSRLSFTILPNEAKVAKRERYEREVDIVKTNEEELPTADKVLLLVSRILNDKSSLPGHVYRSLLEAFRTRCKERESIAQPRHRLSKSDNDNLDHESFRVRRQDAHAVIKYVTATLLEIRPGFAASPAITELAATAVESLVFGEVYDLVIEEIEAAYDDIDNALLEKIADFERRQSKHQDAECIKYKDYVSETALSALHQLPEAHSAVDKLRYCVKFLELISDHFASSTQSENSKPSAMGADSLLKMVCQHVLSAKVFSINAQIAFLEEFARDEQLLRGKEGYALVTLQASLHFLNVSNDFEADIFGEDD